MKDLCEDISDVVHKYHYCDNFSGGTHTYHGGKRFTVKVELIPK
jgi:hypothetical protein